jgi:flagellin-like protein
MKTLRKIRKDAKALSPVVASIILIAVTVAVSIAVAAWMGALSIGFMATEQVSITNCQFSSPNLITLTVSNTGTTAVTINAATVNGADATVGGDLTLGENSAGNQVTVTMASDWSSGDSYSIRIMSTKGNYFPYSVVAP